MIFTLLLLFLFACEKDRGPLNPAGKVRTNQVDPPRSLRVEEGDGHSVDIRWYAPSSDAGFSGRYNVEFKRRSNATYNFSYETEARTYNVNVIRDTTYDYRVRSLASAGWEPSDWVTTQYTLTHEVAVESIASETEQNDEVLADEEEETAAVAIPDEALRRYIEKVLKKNRGATITHAEMKKIVNLLETRNFRGIDRYVPIKSLVGLEAATNLQNVAMGGNEISDLTPLADLVNLRYLILNGNQISDVSPLVNLPKLRFLDIKNNPLSDAAAGEQIPALERRGVEVVPSYLLPPNSVAISIPDVALRTLIEAHLKKQYRQPITQAEMETFVNLWVIGKNIKSLVGLETATNLQEVYLNFNAISDLSPLANLPKLRFLDIKNNPLSDAAVDEQIPALQDRGVEVKFSKIRLFGDSDSPFDIELVFLDDFTEMEQEVWRQVVYRWEAAIQMDLPDYTFSARRNLQCGDHSINISAGERIDDLRIYITSFDHIDPYGRAVGGYGGIELSRSGSLMPIIGCIGINEYQEDFHNIWKIGLHEVGHVLGIGTTWASMLRNLHGDTHFAGPQAIAAFDQAGGTDYQGAKVPVQRHSDPSFDKVHWRGSVMSSELMTQWAWGDLSAITLGALSDLGYTVDFSAADPYELPPPGAAKPVADAVPFCGVGIHPPIYVDD